MSQAVKCDPFLYTNDTCHVCQHKDINKTENQLNQDFCNICDWFVDNKLSILFGEDKTKSIFFASKFKRKNIKKNSHKIWGYANLLLEPTECCIKLIKHISRSYMSRRNLDSLFTNILFQEANQLTN